MVSTRWAGYLLVACLFAPFALGAAVENPQVQEIKIVDTNAHTELKNPKTVRCKTTKVLGSHFQRRVCKTNAEWAAARENANDLMKNAERTFEAEQRTPSF